MFSIARFGILILAVLLTLPVSAQNREAQGSPSAPDRPTPRVVGMRIAAILERDLISLQPNDLDLVEEGFAAWEDLRSALPEKETLPYRRCFDALRRAYSLVLEAADAWAEFTDTRFALRSDELQFVKRVIDADTKSASILLQQAEECCRSAARPAPPPKPESQPKNDAVH